DHRARIGADSACAAQLWRSRYFSGDRVFPHPARRDVSPGLRLAVRSVGIMEPWRVATGGLSVALRVTPRGGRDEIDGIEALANGNKVVKVRVRAVADGG